MKTEPIKTVAIVGGTHGNELTGVFLLKKWLHKPTLVQRPSFSTQLVEANPKAIALKRRYCDRDLNRSFTRQLLNDYQQSDYELERARTISHLLGPKGDAQTDMIIDLHTSTANMQTNIVLTKLDPFHRRLAQYLYQKDNNIRITSEDKLMDDHHFLCSIAEKNAIVEIGPVAQGVGNAETMNIMENAVALILDFIERYNNNALVTNDTKTPIYQYYKTLSLPQDDTGQINGVIHESVQGKDFCLIEPGAPLFRCFDGRVITYQEEQAAYASFVNEAAYYDKLLAMSLSKKIVI